MKAEEGPVDDSCEDILLQKGLRMTLEGKNVSVQHHRNLSGQELRLIAGENLDGIMRAALRFTDDGKVIYVMEDARGRHEVTAGLDHWIDGTTTMTGTYLHHQYEQAVSRIAAIAYWSGENTLTMEWRFPEMAFYDHMRFTWEDGCIKADRWVNMNSQDTSRPTLVLTAE